MLNFKKHIILFVILVLVSTVSVNYAQHLKAPLDLQIKIIPKILSLDKNLKEREKNDFNLGVLFSSKQRSSVETKNKFMKLLLENKMLVMRKEIRVKFIDISNIANIKQYLSDNKIDIAYITPMRGVDISNIAESCKEEKILTITGVMDFMKDSISVGFDIINKKLKIIINNESAKKEGTIFSSRLLRLAKLI